MYVSPMATTTIAGRVSEHVDRYDGTRDRPPLDRPHVSVIHYPADVHRIDVDALNERGELRTIPAGRVHEVAVWQSGGEVEREFGPYDGAARASEVAVRTAEERDLPTRDPIVRRLPGVEARERRLARGRWPPHRDEARRFTHAVPDDLEARPDLTEICIRIFLHPDRDPPPEDDAPLDAFDDRYDVVVADGTARPRDVIVDVATGIRSRDDAVETAIRTARRRERPLHALITPY